MWTWICPRRFSNWRHGDTVHDYKSVVFPFWWYSHIEGTRRKKVHKDTTFNARRSTEMARKNIQHSVFPTHNGVLSHFAAFMVTVGFVIYTSSEKKSGQESTMSRLVETLVRFIHLFSFSTWVGVQFWVHVSGKRNVCLQP